MAEGTSRSRLPNADHVLDSSYTVSLSHSLLALYIADAPLEQRACVCMVRTDVRDLFASS